MPLALSTSWNSFRHTEGESLISEVKKLGFKQVELNFKLNSLIVDQVASLVDKGEIEVVSVHNFCPAPEGVSPDQALPDYYSVSSLDESQRRQAIEQTKKTIDAALRLNARAVVLHCGRVEIPDLTVELIHLYSNGLKNDKEYQDLFSRMLKEREDTRGPFLANALRSLEELDAYAKNKGISLGIENRFYYREIPNFQEIDNILETFEGSTIAYWHDTGHAQVLDNLGLNKQMDYLENYGSRLLGIHLHDVVGGRDHKAPLQGDIDFNMFTPYINKETLSVIEAHHPANSEDIVKAREYLSSIFDGRL